MVMSVVIEREVEPCVAWQIRTCHHPPRKVQLRRTPAPHATLSCHAMPRAARTCREMHAPRRAASVDASTPAAPRMRRPPPSRATMSCTKTRKRARSLTSAHSAPLRYALRYALRCTLRCALRLRAPLAQRNAMLPLPCNRPRTTTTPLPTALRMSPLPPPQAHS